MFTFRRPATEFLNADVDKLSHGEIITTFIYGTCTKIHNSMLCGTISLGNDLHC